MYRYIVLNYDFLYVMYIALLNIKSFNMISQNKMCANITVLECDNVSLDHIHSIGCGTYLPVKIV